MLNLLLKFATIFVLCRNCFCNLSPEDHLERSTLNLNDLKCSEDISASLRQNGNSDSEISKIFECLPKDDELTDEMEESTEEEDCAYSDLEMVQANLVYYVVALRKDSNFQNSTCVKELMGKIADFQKANDDLLCADDDLEAVKKTVGVYVRHAHPEDFADFVKCFDGEKKHCQEFHGLKEDIESFLGSYKSHIFILQCEKDLLKKVELGADQPENSQAGWIDE